MRIGILLFDEVDLLDFGGPYEVFLTAGRLLERRGDVGAIEVLSLSLDGHPVRAYGGVGLIPEGPLDPSLDLDVLVVPGAIAITDVASNDDLIGSIRRAADRVPIVASVCTGAFLLAEAGLLDGRPWTTHFDDVDLLAAEIGSSGATRDVQWVDSGQVVTAGGLSAGIGMTLHLVDRLLGRQLAMATARQIDYDWEPDAGAS